MYQHNYWLRAASTDIMAQFDWFIGLMLFLDKLWMIVLIWFKSRRPNPVSPPLCAGISLHILYVPFTQTGWILIETHLPIKRNNNLSPLAFVGRRTFPTDSVACCRYTYEHRQSSEELTKTRLPHPAPFSHISVACTLFFLFFCPLLCLLLLVHHSSHPSDGRSLTQVFSQSGAQSLVHLVVLSPALSSVYLLCVC